MKKLLSALLIFSCLISTLQSFAQFEQMKAKKKILFEKAVHFDTLFVFDQALEYYKKFQKVNPNNFYVVNKIADIHRLLGHNEDASEWYAKAVTMSEATPQQTLYYAEALRGSGKYEMAKKYFEKYAEQNPNDSRPRKISEGLVNVSSYFKDTASYTVRNLDINTKQADFSPAWYKNNSISFVSARAEDAKKVDKRWSGGQAFLDLYAADFDTTRKKASNPQKFAGKIESEYHEGPMTFDSTYSKIIFTRNNLIKRTKTSKEGIIKLNLFEAIIKDGTWSDVKRLPFNSNEYSCGHPTLSRDGKFLVFASDMPEGKGGQDLYVVEYLGESGWGTPVNLGPDINTEGDEVFPFLNQDGTLYYSSNGMPGLGNLDVYMAQKTSDSQWGFPKNFGAPINSRFDDFGFINNKKKQAGFFSSNREKGKGDDDIYFFDNKQFLLKVLVYDKLSGEPINDATVRIAQNADTLVTQQTDIKGNTIFKVPKGPEYVFKATKEGYKPNYVPVLSDTLNGIVRIPLMRNGFILEALVVDKTTQKPIDNAVILVKNDKTGALDTASRTGLNGKAYPFVLSNNNFTIKADKFGYFLISQVTVSTFNVVGDTIKVKLELSYLAAGSIVKLENIYYDFDKYNIRKDAAVELDRVVEIMQKYPKMKIEMRSHTDSRGSDAYNAKLSQNRATSAAKYIVKEGIAQTRIAYKGYGETVPVNNCTNDAVCSEEEHQLNRRTEFKVLVQPDGTQVKGTIQ